MTPGRPRLWPALAAGVALAAATPPAWFPGAEWLVLVGLGLWFHVATDERRPGWHFYLLGCVHMALFSWSVRNVLFLAYALIVLLGGLYFLLASKATRAVAPRWRAVAFVVAATASFWARAAMPEICYPHGQPCHALYEWPATLLPVVVGGEPLMNALLAAGAVASLPLLLAVRKGTAWRAPLARFAAVVAVWIGTAVVGASCLPVPDAKAPPVRVAAIEPGFHWMQEWLATPLAQRAARNRQLVQERLLDPTRALWSSPSPPTVVLWPESSLHDSVALRDLERGSVRMLPDLLPPAPKSSRLVLGAHVQDAGPPTPAAILLDADGRVLAHQEKRRLVPGGEFQPFFGLLPAAWSKALRDMFERAFLTLPTATPGRELPPLADAAGIKFGALLCYDNAFPEPAAAQVEMGAQWLCVLSNEAWYEGGGELHQLMAMTVIRALETGTPLVRCTLDGWTGWVDARGKLRDHLPVQPAPQPAARILQVDVPPGAGRLPPLAWLRAAVGPLCGIATGSLLLLGLWRWAKLRAARTASRTGASPGLDQGTPGSGS